MLFSCLLQSKITTTRYSFLSHLHQRPNESGFCVFAIVFLVFPFKRRDVASLEWKASSFVSLSIRNCFWCAQSFFVHFFPFKSTCSIMGMILDFISVDMIFWDEKEGFLCVIISTFCKGNDFLFDWVEERKIWRKKCSW